MVELCRSVSTEIARVDSSDGCHKEVSCTGRRHKTEYHRTHRMISSTFFLSPRIGIQCLDEMCIVNEIGGIRSLGWKYPIWGAL
jgi:hypothetical protein